MGEWYDSEIIMERIKFNEKISEKSDENEPNDL
jgi:hypothetical protein